ncbi:hypothetical protein [Roseomonas xinghualingensis]|uniref:hypothetical protein n=1 Tax=Roseomonas xinghualingensis TaxID=2986475 RepID=UPI0021F1F5EE|nr:hypothetical protein [Roseomonas sp. SXEYE001]MCV4209076.1 hypothetical protein [Roseomonas sp. SXEYE001]
MMASKWDDRLRQAAETRGTVTILCSEGEKDEIASAARQVGEHYRLHPQIDRAPANGMRIGFRPESDEGQPPLS